MLNLIIDRWIPARPAGGQERKISIWDVGDPSIQDIVASRQDFRGGLYQYLIALLQLAYAPVDQDEWKKCWVTPPDEAVLRDAFARYVDAFMLESDGPAFMQDWCLPKDANQIPVLGLLIDAGSDSNQFFNKPPSDHGLCESCFAQALLTLQLNAPPGGRGTRTSVRGGGPLTTLLVPAQEPSTLWQKLWLNVLPTEVLGYPEVSRIGDVLPWMAPTRTSDTGGVGDTTPETVHPLQVYWSMPRRIRMDDSTVQEGECAICGSYCTRLIRHYRTRHGGTNYTGAWLHPLTPYNLDPKNEKPPLSVKGQRGGIGYRHWLGLTLGNKDHMPDSARVVRHFTRHSRKLPPMSLWCFGFDMDNMKARCWYDSVLPVHAIDDDLQEDFVECVTAVLQVAKDTAALLHKQVKAAWFKRPGDAASEPSIGQSFWQASESAFYAILEKLSKAELDQPAALAPIYRLWLLQTRRIALDLFDQWVLAVPIEEMNMERVVAARAALGKELNSGKSMKPLWKLVNLHFKEYA